MSLAGLRYQSATFGTAPQETKSGTYIYSGSPSGFHEWEFRTRIRVEFLKQKIKKKALEHKSKSTSTSPERGRAERSPVAGRGGDDDAQATDAPGARRHSGSPEDGQAGLDGQEGQPKGSQKPWYGNNMKQPLSPLVRSQWGELAWARGVSRGIWVRRTLWWTWVHGPPWWIRTAHWVGLLKMRTLQLLWSPWLSVTMMKLQLMGLMTFQKLPNSFM